MTMRELHRALISRPEGLHHDQRKLMAMMNSSIIHMICC